MSSCTEDKKDSTDDIKRLTPLIDQVADMYFIDIWISRSKESEKDSIKLKLENEFNEVHEVSFEDVRTKLKALQKEPELYGPLMDSVIYILKNGESLTKTKN